MIVNVVVVVVIVVVGVQTELDIVGFSVMLVLNNSDEVLDDLEVELDAA